MELTLDSLNPTAEVKHTEATPPIVVEACDTREGIAIDTRVQRDAFRIRLANCDRSHATAFDLLQRMYATRGYQCKPLDLQKDASGRIETIGIKTILAMDGDKSIGTLTVSIDGADGRGLKLDSLFADELEPHRARAAKQRQRPEDERPKYSGLCEFTRLAMDREATRSPQLLAGLFHVAYLYARKVMKMEKVFIEVNPRHVQYYRQMLGFEVMSDVRMHPLVEAEAVLLMLDLGHAELQIANFGGHPELAEGERSAYPYFYGAEEAEGIEKRLVDEAREHDVVATVDKPLPRRSRVPHAARGASARTH
jgi:hypothetical protein